MAAFHWETEYALGVPEMDQQHQEIFHHLARLEAAVARFEKDESIRAVLEAIRQHSAFHFGAEEHLLAGVRFPGLTQQRIQHQQFIQRLRLAERAVGGGRKLSLEEVHGLQSWILGHVVGLDREYLPFVSGEATERSEVPTDE